MKTIKISLLAMGTFLALAAFTRTNVKPLQDGTHYRDTVPYRHYDPNRTYVDIYNGDSLDLWYDPSSRVTTNRRNKRRVDFYVDPTTNDTFYGEGFVVNNLIIKLPNGKYKLDSTKVKIEGNKIKYKDGSDKGKIKMANNRIKTKGSNQKLKVKNNGDTVKIRSRNG